MASQKKTGEAPGSKKKPAEAAFQKRRHLSLVTYSAASDDMVQRARKGIPLARSAAFMALAEQIASSPGKVEFSEEWAEKLAKDFVQFDD